MKGARRSRRGGADTIQEHQMLLIGRAIHSLELNGLHTFTTLFAELAAANWLQLLEIGYDNGKRLVRLLPDTSEQALKFLILILASFIDENQIDTPQSRWRRPSDFGVCTRPLVIQYALYSIHPNVIDTIDVWKL